MPIFKKCKICNLEFKVYQCSKKQKTCSFKCRNKMMTGKKAYNWRGGRRKHNNGYILRYSPNHPYAYHGAVLEHRLVMEKYLGRYLKPEERVHHVNHIKTDNRVKNLILFKNESEHQIYHSGDQLRGIKKNKHNHSL